MSIDGFLETPAVRINQQRLNHLESLNLDISNKRVLEYGAGAGLLTQYFVWKSCKVVSLEGREENVKQFLVRDSDVTVKQFDLEKTNWDDIESADVGFAYGLLYHLGNPKNFIQQAMKKTEEFLILETIVTEDNLPYSEYIVDEDTSSETQSLSGKGCRPSRKIVWDWFKEYFPFVYVPTTQPNHEEFPKSYATKEHHTIRFIIIGSKNPIVNPQLSSELLTTYI
jgi:cyclopropane fatty-acyl-phospholipid synthase-like methyltransferase